MPLEEYNFGTVYDYLLRVKTRGLAGDKNEFLVKQKLFHQNA